MRTLRGILFDFDGTLADTMEGHYLAWKAALAEHGISIEEQDYYPLEGTGLHDLACKFTEGLHLSPAAIDELVQKKKEYFICRQSVTFYPGVEPFISELKSQKVPMAIVTASHMDQLRSSVPGSFLGQFDSLVTGEKFVRGKPDPEPYLEGAKALGLDPGQCVAVENAPLGIRSAKGARTYCIAISTTVRREYLDGADEVLENFAQLSASPVIQRIVSASRKYGK